jgi:hypothetical protein
LLVLYFYSSHWRKLLLLLGLKIYKESFLRLPHWLIIFYWAESLVSDFKTQGTCQPLLTLPLYHQECTTVFSAPSSNKIPQLFFMVLLLINAVCFQHKNASIFSEHMLVHSFFYSSLPFSWGIYSKTHRGCLRPQIVLNFI